VGQIVTAVVRLQSPEPAAAFRVRMRQYCSTRLPSYKVPARIEVSEEPLHSARYKRVHRAERGAA
jgi:acyl-CoA synthetase (AMP-forming)/AMP-acid ligase II